MVGSSTQENLGLPSHSSFLLYHQAWLDLTHLMEHAEVSQGKSAKGREDRKSEASGPNKDKLGGGVGRRGRNRKTEASGAFREEKGRSWDGRCLP